MSAEIFRLALIQENTLSTLLTHLTQERFSARVVQVLAQHQQELRNNATRSSGDHGE